MRLRLAPMIVAAVLLATSCAREDGPSTTEISAGGGLLARDDREVQTLLTPEENSEEAVEPTFRSSIRRVRPWHVRHSWRPGCPVGRGKLRLIRVSHWGFDGTVRQGKLVVRARHARQMVRVMRKLFRAEYPIKRMRLVDAYGADDDRSMAANNTSAFNCRTVAGTSRWSEHAYGRAIDVNPVQNPYVTSSGAVYPPKGERFADRTRKHRAMIRPGDAVVDAFASIGWGWGGDWSSAKDYQHFSATGR